MPRPRAENRLSETERTALAQAIRAVVVAEGGYASVVRNSGVRQPVVSLALHRRLIMRTDNVERLFEYLKPKAGAGEPKDEVRSHDRRERLLGLLANLSDGSDVEDERLSNVLAAIESFARSPQGSSTKLS